MKYRRLSDYKVKKIMKCFCDDLTASTTAIILSINRNTINAYFNEFRVKILDNSITEESKEPSGFSRCRLFWGMQNSLKNGARNHRKNICFGLLKRNERVFVTIAPNCAKGSSYRTQQFTQMAGCL